MQEHWLLDHPEQDKSELYSDPGYEESERNLLSDDRASRAKADLDFPPIEVG